MHNGTYHEYVIVEKTIQLIGEDKNSTIIHMGIKINANSVQISGLTLQNGSGGIWCYNTYDVTITGNTIVHHGNYGVLLENSNNNMISNNTISFNAVGIMYGASEKNICMNNTIESNGVGISDNLSPYISGDKVQLRSQKIGSKIMGMGSQSGGHQDYLSGTMSLRIMIKVYGFYCVGCHQKQLMNITISIPINAVSI